VIPVDRAGLIEHYVLSCFVAGYLPTSALVAAAQAFWIIQSNSWRGLSELEKREIQPTASTRFRSKPSFCASPHECKEVMNHMKKLKYILTIGAIIACASPLKAQPAA
jgi:hypothetical protein